MKRIRYTQDVWPYSDWVHLCGSAFSDVLKMVDELACCHQWLVLQHVGVVPRIHRCCFSHKASCTLCAAVGQELALVERGPQAVAIHPQIAPAQPQEQAEPEKILYAEPQSSSGHIEAGQPRAAVRSVDIDVQADCLPRASLLQKPKSDQYEQQEGDVAQEGAAAQSIDALRPLVTGSWMSLLDQTSTPSTSLQQPHKKRSDSNGPDSICEASGRHGASTSEMGTTADEQLLMEEAMSGHVQFLKSSGLRINARSTLLQADTNQRRSPFLHPGVGMGGEVSAGAFNQPYTSPVNLLKMRPVGPVDTETPCDHATATASPPAPGPTQLSRPKMPALSSASQARLASLQASASGSLRPQSLLERARRQKQVETVVDRLMAGPRNHAAPQQGEILMNQQAPPAGALAALSQKLTRTDGQAEVATSRTKLGPAPSASTGLSVSNTSPLLQDRIVPEFLSQPSSGPQRGAVRRDESARQAWRAPASHADPWAHETSIRRHSQQDQEVVHRRAPRYVGGPREQTQGGSDAASQQLSAMDLIKQMVQRDAMPRKPQQFRCVQEVSCGQLDALPLPTACVVFTW